MNNSVFEKILECIRKHGDIKLVTTDKRRNLLLSESNDHTIKWFSENLLTIRNLLEKDKSKNEKAFVNG